MTASIVDALRASKKGKLKYDPHWCKNGIQNVLEECTSPPRLPIKSIKEVNVLQSIDDSISEIDSIYTFQSSEISGPHVKVRSLETTADSLTDTTDNSSDLSFTISPSRGSIEVAIREYEKEYERQAENAIKMRKDNIDSYMKMINERAGQQIARLEEKAELEREQALKRLQLLEAKKSEESKQRQLKRKEHAQDRVKTLELKMKEAQKRREEEERKKEEEKKILQLLLSSQQHINLYADRMEQLVNNCKHKQHLPNNVKPLLDSFKQYKQLAEIIVSDAKKTNPTKGHNDKMNAVYAKIKTFLEQVNKLVVEAEQKGKDEEEEEEKKKAETAAAEAAAASAAAAAAAKKKAETQSPQSVATASGASASVGLESHVATDALREYEALKEKRKALIESFKDLSDTKDSQLKKYKFDLQKAVNTTVNTISRQSGSHLLSKIQKLHALLSGRPVEVTGKHVSATTHPAGVAFCKDLLAKKIVKQGDEQVAASADSAYPIAAVAVGVWAEFPDFGEILLAEFYQACPYLVPYYIPKKEGQSSEEYYKTQGYRFTDGQVEKQDKFLKRMTGICRLYAAILQSQSPKGPTHPHPHGLERAWIWFARILNLNPHPDITATLIYDMLTVCGHSLVEMYGSQFIKILATLIKDNLPNIERVTPEGSGGPVVRLKIFLEKCLAKNAVPPPEGALSTRFWRS